MKVKIPVVVPKICEPHPFLNFHTSQISQAGDSPGMANKPISPTASPEMEMDPAVWGALPLEILERVFCFLPLKNVIDLRTTCKRFHYLVFSSSFISQYKPVSPSSPSCSSPFTSFLVLSRPNFHPHYLLYDFSMDNWRSSALSPKTPFASPCSLICSSNGLLCFSLLNSASFLVCSFHPRTSRVVKFPRFPFSFELLALIPACCGFKILIVSSGSSSNSVFVYNSEANSWRQFDDHNWIIRDNYHKEGVYKDGSLFFTSTNPFSPICFDLETEKLERHMAELPEELTFMRLVDICDQEGGNKGKMYMFGGVGQNGISRSLKLWELDSEGGGKWVEMETLPGMMYWKFVSVCYHNYEHVYVFGTKG